MRKKLHTKGPMLLLVGLITASSFITGASGINDVTDPSDAADATDQPDHSDTLAGEYQEEVKEFLELIDTNYGDEVPQDLAVKTVTTYKNGNIYKVETYKYEDGKLIEENIECDNIYSAHVIKYEYSGDNLISITTRYAFQPENTYFTKIYHSDDFDLSIIFKDCTPWEAHELLKNDGHPIVSSDITESGQSWHTYRYDNDLITHEASFSGPDTGWCKDYYYDDNDLLRKDVMKYCFDTVVTRVRDFTYDDFGLLIHMNCDFGGDFSADESYENADYEYVIDNGMGKIVHGDCFDNYGNPTGGKYKRFNIYDEHGWMVRNFQLLDGEDDPVYETNWTNTYDDQGRIIRSVCDCGTPIKDNDYITEYEYR